MDPRRGGCPSSRQASSPAFLQGLLSPGTLGVDSPEVCRMASVSIRYYSGMQPLRGLVQRLGTVDSSSLAWCCTQDARGQLPS